MYKICIIIPVYNEEEFLTGCLDSIVNQSMDIDDIQIILVNDGSSDSSADIIDKYVKSYSSFMCITRETPSGGCAEPRNIAMDFVDSEYIMFVDADDRIDRDYCKILYNQIEVEKSNCVICNHLTFFEDDIKYKRPHNLTIDFFNPLDVPYNPILFTAWGKIFKTEFLNKNNLLFTNQLWEDILFFAYFCYYNKTNISFISNYCGYFYNKIRWGYTLSSSEDAKKISKVLGRIEVLRELSLFSKKNDDIFEILCVFLLKWNLNKLFTYSLNKNEIISYVNALNDLINEFNFNVKSPFHYSFIFYLVINKKYNFISILRTLKFKFCIMVFDVITK